jgi:predicted RNase H-like HicB family nuclease
MTAPPNVPVFNCVVNVTSPAADGMIVATVANLAGLAAQGKSVRDAIAAAVGQFKATVGRYHTEGKSIPWIDPPVPPAANESQRLIAVHL